MLFPVWIQSVEKYADIQPLNLLAKVAAGNDPGNFLFCLNKMDQVSAEEAEELREDFRGGFSGRFRWPNGRGFL